ncbi:CLUMA_CG013535, isoform A [Clunio marinus]|uniref:CLUMA_CG013535, isoform A n=1 Tax=Clunio marinus TaxID=568069 RepID=A0A1J1IMF0_9DIPT|nr:CLUMA_CG013535, isoform A [Clunio marinus]
MKIYVCFFISTPTSHEILRICVSIALDCPLQSLLIACFRGCLYEQQVLSCLNNSIRFLCKEIG